VSRISYTHKTMEALRKRGHRVGLVERYNQFSRKRTDLFGFIDAIAIQKDEIIGIQSTSGTNHSGHRKKILEERADEARAWIIAGGKIELWSWSRHKVKRGGKAVRWTPRVEEITLEDLTGRGSNGTRTTGSKS